MAQVPEDPFRDPAHHWLLPLTVRLGLPESVPENLWAQIPELECPKPLGVLSERITSTLQTLELQCGMRDCHFNVIMPALGQCSQLTKVNYYHNYISLLVPKNLLHHTAKLSKLTPLECYDSMTIFRDIFKQLCPELLDIHTQDQKAGEESFLCYKNLLGLFSSLFLWPGGQTLPLSLKRIRLLLGLGIKALV